MINDVHLILLKQFYDERGAVMHMLRKDAPHFKEFGEVYFSWINPGMTKGWRQHRMATLNFAVPVGCIKVVIVDQREESSTKNQIDEYVLGPDNYSLLIIPPHVWYGAKNIAKVPSMIVNCSTHPHDPTEILRQSPDDALIPYNLK